MSGGGRDVERWVTSARRRQKLNPRGNGMVCAMLVLPPRVRRQRQHTAISHARTDGAAGRQAGRHAAANTSPLTMTDVHGRKNAALSSFASSYPAPPPPRTPFPVPYTTTPKAEGRQKEEPEAASNQKRRRDKGAPDENLEVLVLARSK